MYQRPPERTQGAYRGRGGHFLNTLFVGVMSAAIAGVVVWVVAFGGASGITDLPGRVQFSSSSPFVTIASPHQDVADSALLTVGDLPPGWVILPDDDDDFGPDHELTDYCKALQDKASKEGVDSSATSDDMGGPENQWLKTDAAVFSNPEDAQRSLENIREFFSRCGRDLIAQLEDGVRRGAASGGTIPAQLQFQTTMTDLGAPPVGESGLFFRVNGTVTGPNGAFDFALDLIAFRIGRMSAGLVYLQGAGLPPDQHQAIAQIAAAKLQTANASLPDA
jgi:hypothetical protein